MDNQDPSKIEYNFKHIPTATVLISTLEAFTPEKINVIKAMSKIDVNVEDIKKTIMDIDETIKNIPSSLQLYVISLFLVGLIFNAKFGQFDPNNADHLSFIYDSYMNNSFLLAQATYVLSYRVMAERVTN